MTGHGVVLGGQNVIEDCFVYNLAGIAFGAWATHDNKIYRSRAENCGLLEATEDDFWSGEHASGDGFYFVDRRPGQHTALPHGDVESETFRSPEMLPFKDGAEALGRASENQEISKWSIAIEALDGSGMLAYVRLHESDKDIQRSK